MVRRSRMRAGRRRAARSPLTAGVAGGRRLGPRERRPERPRWPGVAGGAGSAAVDRQRIAAVRRVAGAGCGGRARRAGAGRSTARCAAGAGASGGRRPARGGQAVGAWASGGAVTTAVRSGPIAGPAIGSLAAPRPIGGRSTRRTPARSRPFDGLPVAEADSRSTASRNCRTPSAASSARCSAAGSPIAVILNGGEYTRPCSSSVLPTQRTALVEMHPDIHDRHRLGPAGPQRVHHGLHVALVDDQIVVARHRSAGRRRPRRGRRRAARSGPGRAAR